MNTPLETAWNNYATKMEEHIKIEEFWREAVVNGPPPDEVATMARVWREASELLMIYFELFDEDQHIRFPDTVRPEMRV